GLRRGRNVGGPARTRTAPEECKDVAGLLVGDMRQRRHAPVAVGDDAAELRPPDLAADAEQPRRRRRAGAGRATGHGAGLLVRGFATFDGFGAGRAVAEGRRTLLDLLQLVERGKVLVQ